MEKITVTGKLNGENFRAELIGCQGTLTVSIVEDNKRVNPNLEFSAPLKVNEKYFRAWLHDHYRIEGRGRKLELDPPSIN